MTCNRQTDGRTQGHSTQSASTASHGKNSQTEHNLRKDCIIVRSTVFTCNLFVCCDRFSCLRLWLQDERDEQAS